MDRLSSEEERKGVIGLHVVQLLQRFYGLGQQEFGIELQPFDRWRFEYLVGRLSSDRRRLCRGMLQKAELGRVSFL